MGKILDLTGRRFGSLVVQCMHPDTDSAGRARWISRCDCGEEKVVRSQGLVRGSTTTCGCGRGTKRLKHGENTREHGKSAEYRAWDAMMGRVRETSRSAPNYFARGIRVCARWCGPDGFAHFLADMGRKPSPRHSLDRIDNDGDYEPTNCRWATATVQVHNRRPPPNIIIKGVCPQGHLIQGEADYRINTQGSAVCYTCRIEYGRQRRKRMREERNAQQ